MSRPLNIAIGQVSGRLTVVRQLPNKNGKRMFECRCECGALCPVSASAIENETTKSCGCLQREHASKQGRRNAGSANGQFKHGSSVGGKRTHEYIVWMGMRQGHPTEVSGRWLKFSNFQKDMGPRPSSKHRLARLDKTANYGPGNCQWVVKEKAPRKPKQPKPAPTNPCRCGCGELVRNAYAPGHRQKNRFEHRPDGTTIIFVEHKHKILEFVVDTPDYGLVKDFRWHAYSRRGETYYAKTGRNGVKMEHILLPPVDGKTPDHKDRNGLNNRRSNLRLANPAQQAMNQFRRNKSKTSRFRGVSWNKDCQKFRVLITVEGRKTHIGLFESEEDAARAYDAAARKHFGDFARTNFDEQGKKVPHPGARSLR